jgi:DNA polymerase III subunit gamma/tau
LKTLEEPPEHVKFIFATTEIRKVPVTILSRCQRFDLRRLDGQLLMQHFGNVAQKEGVQAEEEALRMIARAAEGSVRDGLSLLDQAIAYGGTTVTAEHVQSMLGLIDRALVIDLFEALMKGNAADALQALAVQHRSGGDPVTILTDLADFVHWVTRLKVNPAAVEDPARAEAEKTRGAEIAKTLPMAALTRAWQMLIKGLAELKDAPDTMAAAEMVLIRLAYAADLPSTEDLVKKAQSAASTAAIANGGARLAGQGRIYHQDAAAPSDAPRMSGNLALNRNHADTPVAQAPAAVTLTDFRSVVALVADKRDIKLKTDLELYVRPVRMSAGQIEIALEPKAPPTLAGELSRKLEGWTGRRWMVLISKEAGERPVAEQNRDARQSLMREARANATVQAVLAAFPKADITDVRDPEPQGFAGDGAPEREENPES